MGKRGAECSIPPIPPSSKPQGIPCSGKQTQAWGGGLIQLCKPPHQLQQPSPRQQNLTCLQVPRTPGSCRTRNRHRPPLGELFMLYNTPVLKRAAALAAMKKTSTSKCPARVESILWPGMLLTPAEHLSFIMSQVFLDGVEKCTPDPKAAFQGSRLQGMELVPFTPSSLWWFRSKWVELGLES